VRGGRKKEEIEFLLAHVYKIERRCQLFQILRGGNEKEKEPVALRRERRKIIRKGRGNPCNGVIRGRED